MLKNFLGGKTISILAKIVFLCFVFTEIADPNVYTLLVKGYYQQGILKGEKYHCTVDFLFDWFGLVCFANKNKYCQLSYN
jgi:hypothetical protein